MANLRLANQTQQDACDAVVDYIDNGTGAGTIEIRSGTQPANANLTATGTLLATLTFNTTAFGDANTSGQADAAAITADTSADATGTATWARIKTSGGATVMDCDVGTTASTATLQLDSVNIVAGGNVAITAFSVTMPDGT
jgi:hypothetical protein